MNDQIITTDNAELDDVRPGDYIIWEWVMVHGGLTMTSRREGIAAWRDQQGEWWTAEDMCITAGSGDEIALTIHRQIANKEATK